MQYAQFTKWWKDLTSAMMDTLPSLVYNPSVIDDAPLSNDFKAAAVQKVLGIKYGNKTTASWFSQHEVVML
jgi:hypothetical protein